MGIRVFITSDYEHMSELAAHIAGKKIRELLREKDEITLGLATGNSPAGMYKYLAQAANKGEFDSSRIRSFNLDEYVGLPGENAQQRVMHRESYCYFMIREFFGLMNNRFIETNVPSGSLIDQKTLMKELKRYPGDWEFRGMNSGKSIVIRQKARSEYLAWIRREILDGYARKIRKAGGIDLQIIGVGGRGHVAFHESGIPFRGSSVMLVKLDNETINNAIADGHFSTPEDSPSYAVSMGAELVYKGRNIMLLANGERKVDSITRSLLGDITPEVPISYGQTFAKKDDSLTYVLDKIAGRELLAKKDLLERKEISVEGLT